MRPIGLLILVMALSAPAWSTCQAAGSYQTKPMFPDVKVVQATVAVPTINSPQQSRGYLLGCGKGRIRDPETHGCRGPADIR
jgi:hypothetical protein